MVIYKMLNELKMCTVFSDSLYKFFNLLLISVENVIINTRISQAVVMLIVVVLVFFVCWLPIYTLNTFIDLLDVLDWMIPESIFTKYADFFNIGYIYKDVQRPEPVLNVSPDS